ncbi:MAG: trigger factor [Betaproteobacteria bacterium]|nr:trigger factor [Betaproteobacteria bacterium]
MQATIETISTLERRLKVSLPMQEVDSEVDNRLRRMARTVRMHGFRPGKVPFKLVEKQYGGQIRQEVLGDILQKSFGEAIRQKNLRVAGYPRFEANQEAGGQGNFEYNATFEVYPEVKLGAMENVEIKRPAVNVGDPEVDKTIEILRKQRASYLPVEREAQKGDRVLLDFEGKREGAPFEGGVGKDHMVLVGENRYLADFEANVVGVAKGQSKQFELTFPADYHAPDLAGKPVVFDIQVKEVAQTVLPEVDAEFAKQLGIADGDVARLREDVRANLQREVSRRIQARVKDQVMKSLHDTSEIEVPKSLVEMEVDRLRNEMTENLRSRGGEAPAELPKELFETEAKRRVALGLIIAELVRVQDLQAKPEQLKEIVAEHAQSYEKPEEVVRWYYQSQERLREVESLALENNVVSWVLGASKVEDVPTDFDELMGNRT